MPSTRAASEHRRLPKCLSEDCCKTGKIAGSSSVSTQPCKPNSAARKLIQHLSPSLARTGNKGRSAQWSGSQKLHSHRSLFVVE
eukprot:4731873-Pyramimonas_sp.AAC.1